MGNAYPARQGVQRASGLGSAGHVRHGDRWLRRDARIWELSRFALETDKENRHGIENGLTHYVTVTTTAMKRLTRRAGVVTSRLGAPQRIGIENAVAFSVDVRAT